MQTAVKNKNINGLFEVTIKVGKEVITVRGNVVNGTAKIGTVFK
ncbi:hypothetical protein CRYPA_8 [uncultured Candidatus Thioglobus sp.]|nr:hypothetical protein CRYPA_8 [uncultured Candidatus Thioglobus sp.]